MRQLGLEEKNLIKTDTAIRAANDARLEVMGFIPVSMQVVGILEKKGIQALYITKELNSSCSSPNPAYWNWDVCKVLTIPTTTGKNMCSSLHR